MFGMNIINKMFLGGFLFIHTFISNLIPFAITDKFSADDLQQTLPGEENLSMTYKMQMDRIMGHQLLSPPWLKAQNSESIFCEALAKRALKQMATSYKSDLNETDSLEDSLLHRAAKLGREQEVAFLLSSGANASQAGVFKRTPLHWAASNGFGGIIMLLIVHGACINCKDKWGFTSLHLAVNNNHKESVEILIKKGALRNTKNIDGRTPLHDAARNGYFDLIPLLIDSTSINLPKPYQSTPLHEATIGNHLEVVNYFIGKHFNLNAMDEMKRTPLHWAVFYNHERIALLLISKGAGLNRKDCDGLSPLHLSAMKGYKKLTEVLIKNGAFKNSRSKKGHTPLNEASRNGQMEIVQLLIKEGVELENGGSVATDGSTPLFEAVERGFSDIVEILINHGARFNITNNMGKTPLHRAVEQDDKEMVNLLVHKGAEITVEDYRGYTPYVIACEKGNMEILQQLFVYCVCYNYTNDCKCLSIGNDVVDLPTACQCIAAKGIKSEEGKISGVQNKSIDFNKCPCFMIKNTVSSDSDGSTEVPQPNTALQGLCLKASKIITRKFNNPNCPLTPDPESIINSTVCLGHVVRFLKNTVDNSIIFH